MSNDATPLPYFVQRPEDTARIRITQPSHDVLLEAWMTQLEERIAALEQALQVEP